MAKKNKAENKEQSIQPVKEETKNINSDLKKGVDSDGQGVTNHGLDCVEYSETRLPGKE